MKKRQLTKTESQRIHIKQRLRERYNIDANRTFIHRMITAIQTGNAVHLGKQSRRVSHFRINIDSVDIYVVYDKVRHNVVTVLDSATEVEKMDVSREEYLSLRNCA